MIIHTYKKIPKREILDCRIKTIQEFFRHYNIDINSYYLLILAESVSFNYGKINFPELSIFNVPYAVASNNHIEKTIFSNLNIKYVEEKIDSNDFGWKKLKYILKKNNPVITKIDGRVMYNSSTTIPQDSKIKLHYLSSLLLVGYSEDELHAKVVITNTNNKDTPSDLLRTDFQEYRNSECIPYSPECRCYYATENPDSTIVMNNLHKKMYISLNNISKNMLSKDINKINLKNFDCTNLSTGITALKYLFSDLSLLYNKMKKEKNDNNVILKKYTIFSLLFLRNNLLYGSHSLFREELGKGISFFSDEIGTKELKNIGSELIKSSLLWKEIFSLISQMPHNKKNMKLFNKILKKLNKIIKIEETAFKKLKHCTERYLN